MHYRDVRLLRIQDRDQMRISAGLAITIRQLHNFQIRLFSCMVYFHCYTGCPTAQRLCRDWRSQTRVALGDLDIPIYLTIGIIFYINMSQHHTYTKSASKQAFNMSSRYRRFKNLRKFLVSKRMLIRALDRYRKLSKQQFLNQFRYTYFTHSKVLQTYIKLYFTLYY